MHNLEQDELKLAEIVTELFEQEIARKFSKWGIVFDYPDCKMYEVGGKIDEHYVVLGIRYRTDNGEFVIRGQLFNEQDQILKRKRMVINEKTLATLDDDYKLHFNEACRQQIKVLLGAYIEIAYTTLFI